MTKTLWAIGDSTMSSFHDEYYYPRYGYGTKLKEYLDDSIEVRNLALSGRSSKSFLTEDNYSILMNEMKSGDFLLIGFGHNDEKCERARYTDPNGDYKTPGSFAENLYKNYMKKAEERGVTVILATPIVRRSADGEWTGEKLHFTKDAPGFKGGDYAQAVRDLAAATDTPLVDMTKLTKDLYDRLTPAETLYLHAWTSDLAISVDNTHTNIYGGRVNAWLCLKAIAALDIEGLSEHVLTERMGEMPKKQEYLSVNPDFKPVIFSSDIEESKLWKPFDVNGHIFHGTVFGDIGVGVTTEHFRLSEENGEVSMAVKLRHGKIAMSSDGIAFYYTKLPASATFTLEADLVVHMYNKDNQTSFGLMVRDDCYTDAVTAGILGDYVACAPLRLADETGHWNNFARKSGQLTEGLVSNRDLPVETPLHLVLKGTNDGYSCKFGEEEAVSGGFDFALTRIDPEHIYVGLFAARDCDVTFKNVRLEVE